MDHAPVPIFGEISRPQKEVDSSCRTVVTVQRKVVAWSEQRKIFFVCTCLVTDLRCVFVLGSTDLNITAQCRCSGANLFNHGS